MIELTNVNKKFKNFELTDINLKFDSGKTYYFVGKNGSGKTTIFKILLGILDIDSGAIKYRVNKKEFLNNCSIMSDVPTFHEDYSGFINLDLILGKYDKQKLKELCMYYNFDYNLLKKDVCFYSLGQRRLLSIFIIILENKDILILDEPTIGLDFYTWSRFESYLQSVKNNKLIIISGHNYNELYDVCDEIIILESGYIVEITNKNDFINGYKTVNEKIADLFLK